MDDLINRGEAIELFIKSLNNMPSAQPKRTEERTETHACDCISRQAAIDAIEEYADRLQMVNWKENPGVPYKAYALNWCINTIRDLPSAQPELTWCSDCKHNRNAIGSYVHCDILPQMYGRKPEDNYCSYAERRPDK